MFLVICFKRLGAIADFTSNKKICLQYPNISYRNFFADGWGRFFAEKNYHGKISVGAANNLKFFLSLMQMYAL